MLMPFIFLLARGFDDVDSEDEDIWGVRIILFKNVKTLCRTKKNLYETKIIFTFARSFQKE
ncbi:hypothetical protein FACS1894123_03080 [Bacteroidia bacterium]|nr:hypothetical protein FACS1894123_03080 [Bacteroidia bacterium]